jgi:putative membrane protein
MKRFSLILGFATLAALWWGPLPEMTRHSFAAHMALHMGVVAVAAPLIAIGISGGVFDPVRRWPSSFPPIPLSIVELVVVWAWHAPVLHHAAREAPGGFVLEQVSFFTAGLLVWISSMGGRTRWPHERAGAGVAALLLTSMHMTLLGALLALTPRPLYMHMEHDGGSSLTALDDQQLGGAIMLVVGGISYLAGGLALTVRLVRVKSAESEERA